MKRNKMPASSGADLARKLMAATVSVAMALTVSGVVAQAAGPEVARVTSAPAGCVVQIYGEGFAPGKVEVRMLDLPWPGNPQAAAEVQAAALKSAAALPRLPALPAVPPAEARPARVLDSTAQVVAFVRLSGQGAIAVWARNQGGEWSAPCLAGLPEPWWLDRAEAAPGEQARLYGRMLLARYATAVIVLKAGDQVLRARSVDWHDITYFANEYVTGFDVPAEAKAGEWEVWVHNGTGADWGWMKAGMLRVRPTPKPAPELKVVDANKSGAKGDGITDDTAALEKALSEADKTKGGVVYLPPGQYRITRCLRVPAGVSLRGAGNGNSVIISAEVAPVAGGFPTEMETWEEKGMPNDWHPYVVQSTPMLWVRSNTAVTDLGLEQRGGEGVCLLVANPGESCDNVRVTNCRIRNSFMGARIDKRYNPSFGCVWVPNRSRGLVIADNTLESVSSTLVILGRMDRGQIVRNQMYSLADNQCDLVGIRGGPVECVITDNRIHNSKRGFTFQQPRPSMYHNYLARNTQEWVDRGGNANETLLMEGWSTTYQGKATAGTVTSITVKGQNWKPGAMRERYVLVLAGRGLGQYGIIRDNTEDTVTLVTPWRVPINETTEIVIGNFFADNVFADQNDRRSGAAFQFWGNCLGNTVSGLHSYDTEGIIFWAGNSAEYGSHGGAPYCYFNEVVDSYMMGMGHVELRGFTHQDKAKLVTEAPALLGNVIRDTAMVDYGTGPNNQPGAYWKWYSQWMQPFAGVDFWSAIHGEGYRHGVDQPELWKAGMPPVYAYNVVDGCLMQRGPRGVRVSPGAYHTLVYGAKMDEVTTPVVDQGEGTVVAEK